MSRRSGTADAAARPAEAGQRQVRQRRARRWPASPARGRPTQRSGGRARGGRRGPRRSPVQPAASSASASTARASRAHRDTATCGTGLDQLGGDLRVDRPEPVRRAVAGQRARAAGRLLAWQIRRPCQIARWDRSVQSRFGSSRRPRARPSPGPSSAVHCQRRTSRPKWVSTVMPGIPNALPRITFAVLRPIPGSVDQLVQRAAAPRRRTARPAPGPGLISDVVLFRKKPVEWIISSSSARSAAA